MMMMIDHHHHGYDYCNDCNYISYDNDNHCAVGKHGDHSGSDGDDEPVFSAKEGGSL